MAPKPGKVSASKGDAHVYQTGTSLSKAQITTLLAASASGHYIPLMIVYPVVQPHNQLREDFHNQFPQGLWQFPIRLDGLRIICSMVEEWIY